MARGKKSGGRNFQPGQSGNLGGRPQVAEDLRSLKVETKVHIESKLFQISSMTLNQVEEKYLDQNASVTEKILAKCFLEAVRTGDVRRIDFLLERLLGKPKEIDVHTKKARSLHAEIVDLCDEIERESGTDFLEDNDPMM